MRLVFASTDLSATADLSETDLVDLYRHRLPSERAVWLRSNFVATLDGAITGPDGRAGSINTPSDQHVFGLHRAHADVILVGAQTVRSERYRGVDLPPWQREIRSAAGLSEFPMLAVVTRSLDLDPALGSNGALDVGPVTIFTTAGKSPAALAPFTSAGVEIVQLDGAELDLVQVVDQLSARGFARVLTEGGPRLHRDLLARDLVDELSLTLAPLVVGGHGGRTTAGEWLDDPAAFALRFALYADDGTLFLNYVRENRSPAAGVT